MPVIYTAASRPRSIRYSELVLTDNSLFITIYTCSIYPNGGDQRATVHLILFRTCINGYSRLIEVIITLYVFLDMEVYRIFVVFSLSSCQTHQKLLHIRGFVCLKRLDSPPIKKAAHRPSLEVTHPETLQAAVTVRGVTLICFCWPTFIEPKIKYSGKI